MITPAGASAPAGVVYHPAMPRSSFRLLALAIGATSWACHGSPTTAVPPAARIVIAPAAASVEIGAVQVLTDTVYDGSGQVLDLPVTWNSSEPDVATISPDGEVVGLAIGEVVITAKREGITGTATVEVVPAAVASVVVTPTPDTLVPPQTLQLTAALADARGVPLTGRVVQWATRDPFTADVTAGGLVTAVSPGATYVVATSAGQTDSALIVVKLPPPNGLTIEVTNHLAYSIAVSVNGSSRGFAAPGSILTLVGDSIPLLRISWTLRPPLDAGQPVGEVVSDTLPPVTKAGGLLTFDVTSQLTDGRRIFTPYLNNTSASTLQIDIPIRGSAQPCSCILPSDPATHNTFGYWPLDPDATVDGYGRNDSGHTGPKVSVPVLPADVDPVTGIWKHTFTVGP